MGSIFDRCLIDFGILFGLILCSKIDQKRHQKNDRCWSASWDRFWSILDPKTDPNWARIAVETLPDRSRTALRPLQNAPGPLPDPSQPSLRPILDRFLINFRPSRASKNKQNRWRVRSGPLLDPPRPFRVESVLWDKLHLQVTSKLDGPAACAERLNKLQIRSKISPSLFPNLIVTVR